MKRQTAKNGAAKRTAKTSEVIFELKGVGDKRLGAVLINAGGSLFYHDGSKVQPISFEAACLKMADLHRRERDNDDLSSDTETIATEARWHKLVADYVIRAKKPGKKSMGEDCENYPRLWVTKETDKLAHDLSAINGDDMDDLVRVGLVQVAARLKAGQQLEPETKVGGKKLRLIYRFAEHFPNEYNSLFISELNELYHTNMVDDGTIWEPGKKVPLAEAEHEHFKPVSIADALSWYGRCREWSIDSSGDIGEVCLMAAKAMA